MEDKIIKRIYTYHLSLADGTIVKYSGEGLFHNKVDGDITKSVLIHAAVITHIEEIENEYCLHEVEKLYCDKDECNPVEHVEDISKEKEIDPKKMTQDKRNAYYESLLTPEEKEMRNERLWFVENCQKRLKKFFDFLRDLQIKYIDDLQSHENNPSKEYIKKCNDGNENGELVSCCPGYDKYSVESFKPACPLVCPYKGERLVDCPNYECHKLYESLDYENRWKLTKYGKIPPFLDKPIQEIPLPVKSNFKRKKSK